MLILKLVKKRGYKLNDIAKKSEISIKKLNQLFLGEYDVMKLTARELANLAIALKVNMQILYIDIVTTAENRNK